MSAKSSSGRRPRRGAGLRPLREQIAVVTGGSSGIGRESAIRFGRAGATVVVIARDEDGLSSTVEQITADGGRAQYIVADITDASAMRAAVEQVESAFGRIDTWVGNAGVLLYGRFEETSPEEFRRMLEVNFIGQLHGILAALPALRRAGGGALICVSSAEAVVTLPMHSAYAASKRALEGALDGLRRELLEEGTPISVTAVRPGVIDTPIYPHARSHMDRRPKAPPPYYDPAVVADAILYAAEHPVRTIHAGGGARMITTSQALLPGVVDAVLGGFGARLMHTDEPVAPAAGNLDQSVGGGESRGGLPRAGRRWSISTWLSVHPVTRSAVAISAVSLGGAALVRRLRR